MLVGTDSKITSSQGEEIPQPKTVRPEKGTDIMFPLQLLAVSMGDGLGPAGRLPWMALKHLASSFSSLSPASSSHGNLEMGFQVVFLSFSGRRGLPPLRSC